MLRRRTSLHCVSTPTVVYGAKTCVKSLNFGLSKIPKINVTHSLEAELSENFTLSINKNIHNIIPGRQGKKSEILLQKNGKYFVK
jgi:hypothetical protein